MSTRQRRGNLVNAVSSRNGGKWLYRSAWIRMRCATLAGKFSVFASTRDVHRAVWPRDGGPALVGL